MVQTRSWDQRDTINWYRFKKIKDEIFIRKMEWYLHGRLGRHYYQFDASI